MDIIAENKFKTASQIYYCLVKSTTSGRKCIIDFNNEEYTVPYFAGTPRPNRTYALFLPQNNMNQAFVIGEGGSGGGGGSGIAVQPDPPTGDELVWIDTDDPGTQHIIPEIDDNNISADDTWSSQKIENRISWKTIWTNSSSSDDFSPQTIAYDLSSYSEFAVRFCVMKSATPDTADNFEFLYTCKSVVFFATGWAGAYARGRSIKITDVGVQFGSGMYLTAYASNGAWSINNANFVPISIKVR